VCSSAEKGYAFGNYYDRRLLIVSNTDFYQRIKLRRRKLLKMSVLVMFVVIIVKAMIVVCCLAAMWMDVKIASIGSVPATRVSRLRV
jgi:hypothetical protein